MPLSDRRDFLTVAMAAVSAHLLTTADAAAAPVARIVAQRDTPKVNLDGWQVTVNEVSYPPGEASGVHHHPGFVIGYVLEGQYRFAVNDQPPKVLAAGEMFFESFDAPGEIHAVSGNASTTQTTKILAIAFTKKGDPVTIQGR